MRPEGAVWEHSFGDAVDRPDFRMRAPATARAVRDVLANVAEHCRAAALPAAACEDLQIVLGELLNNVVEHGNAGRETGVLDLSLRLGRSAIHCCLRDDGAALPGGCFPKGAMPDIDLPTASLPEGGFGVSLIRALTRDLGYLRAGDENRTFFRIPLGGRGGRR